MAAYLRHRHANMAGTLPFPASSASMFLKALRRKKLLSQEQLAELSGLSLRTIQRVERGHRASYASLRSLAAAVDMDVDILEQEIYAMDKVINEYKDFPFWVRFACGKGWFSASRHELHKIELFALFFSALGCLVWISGFIWELPIIHVPYPGVDMGNFFGLCGVGCLFSAYNLSIAIRVGDKYDVWSKLEATQPGGFFGKNP